MDNQTHKMSDTPIRSKFENCDSIARLRYLELKTEVNWRRYVPVKHRPFIMAKNIAVVVDMQMGLLPITSPVYKISVNVHIFEC